MGAYWLHLKINVLNPVNLQEEEMECQSHQATTIVSDSFPKINVFALNVHIYIICNMFGQAIMSGIPFRFTLIRCNTFKLDEQSMHTYFPLSTKQKTQYIWLFTIVCCDYSKYQVSLKMYIVICNPLWWSFLSFQ